MPDLPAPITVTDQLLVALHDVLGEIRDRLPEPAQSTKQGRTTVSEPASPGQRKNAGRRTSERRT
jgi:hypothetical protein